MLLSVTSWAILSASEVTTLWRDRNVCVIIIIIYYYLNKVTSETGKDVQEKNQ